MVCASVLLLGIIRKPYNVGSGCRWSWWKQPCHFCAAMFSDSTVKSGIEQGALCQCQSSNTHQHTKAINPCCSERFSCSCLLLQCQCQEFTSAKQPFQHHRTCRSWLVSFKSPTKAFRASFIRPAQLTMGWFDSVGTQRLCPVSATL